MPKERQKRTWELTRPHKTRKQPFPYKEIPIGGIINMVDHYGKRDEETFICFRQRKKEKASCYGCVFFERRDYGLMDRQCAAVWPCQRYQRNDMNSVIFKQITPTVVTERVINY